MIALYVDGKPELIDTLANVSKRITKIKASSPGTDIEKREPSYCGSCGSSYFDHYEAITCPCHDY